MSDQAAFWRRAKRKADRLNREHDERNPLFAGQWQTTAREQYWHTRRVIVGVACHGSELRLAEGLRWLEVRQRERMARQLLSPEEYAAAVERLSGKWMQGHEVAFYLDVWYQLLKDRCPEMVAEVYRRIRGEDKPADHFDQTALALYRRFFPEV
jgi:hypothetical protein